MVSEGETESGATFRALRTFGLESRNLFVISGDVVQGSVVAGMRIHVPLNSAVSIEMTISSVEYVDGPGDRSEVGLTFECAAWDEVQLLCALRIQDEVLTISSGLSDSPG